MDDAEEKDGIALGNGVLVVANLVPRATTDEGRYQGSDKKVHDNDVPAAYLFHKVAVY